MTKEVIREILIGFWKAHILHHASQGPLVGQWMLNELRHHGYDISPGTLYPLLNRMEKRGWLQCKRDPKRGSKSRKDYFITKKGRDVLKCVKKQVAELHHELEEQTKK